MKSKFNLPQTAKEQKVWMKRLGITDIRCAKMAIIRDECVATAKKRLDRRDFPGALTAIHTADRMQVVIESSQDILKVIK